MNLQSSFYFDKNRKIQRKKNSLQIRPLSPFPHIKISHFANPKICLLELLDVGVLSFFLYISEITGEDEVNGFSTFVSGF
jgi:hypothetical protein